MKKAILTLTFSLATFTNSFVFAQYNPFADIYPEHWSYQATRELVQSGLVDDYTNSMFAQNKRIARYALVQLIGQAIYRQGEANPEDQQIIKKLALEYQEDFARLGLSSPTQRTENDLAELASRVKELEESTSGIKDLKISGFFQTENSYGRRYKKEDAKHEYELEARIQLDKKITDKLFYTHQIATKTYLDAYSAAANDNYGSEFPNSNKEKVYTRLAYATWIPGSSIQIQAGKMAVWLAGGFLGDDYVKGISFKHHMANNWEFALLASRYSSNTNWPGMTVIPDDQGGYELFRNSQDRNIWYAEFAKSFGQARLGLHYLSANNSFVSNNETKIYAVTFDFSWQKLNWSLAYAQNTAENNANSLYKLQALYKLEKGNFILQYWRNEQNINLPLEHGNHMAFWTDTYSTQGLKGVRAIYALSLTDNIFLETFYGYYKSLSASQSASKYGFATTLSF